MVDTMVRAERAPGRGEDRGLGLEAAGRVRLWESVVRVCGDAWLPGAGGHRSGAHRGGGVSPGEARGAGEFIAFVTDDRVHVVVAQSARHGHPRTFSRRSSLQRIHSRLLSAPPPSATASSPNSLQKQSATHLQSCARAEGLVCLCFRRELIGRTFSLLPDKASMERKSATQRPSPSALSLIDRPLNKCLLFISNMQSESACIIIYFHRVTHWIRIFNLALGLGTVRKKAKADNN